MQYTSYPSYINSRYDDAIKIPESWNERRLKFVASYNDESLPETTDADYEIEYVDISSVDLVNGITNLERVSFEKAPSRARRIARDGDTIVSTVRTYLKAIASIEQPPENLIVSTGFAVIRPKDEIDKSYLSYFLQCQNFVELVVANSVGVSYPAINAADLVCLPTYFPESKGDQQKIVAFLDYKTQQIDQLIEKKKSLIEKLEENRIAVITQAVTKGLDNNAKLKPSGVDWLSDVPVHWNVKRLRFLLSESLTNGLFKKSEFWGRGRPIVNVFDAYIHGDIVDENSLDRVECVDGEYEKYSVLDGDFFFVRSSLKLEGVGKSATVLEPNEELVFECHLVRGRPDQLIVDPRYLNYCLNSKYAREYFVSNANVVTMATIDQMKLKNLQIALPALNEQRDIVKAIEKSISKMDGLCQKASMTIYKLEEYRSSLITSAVTGKIDVREIEVPKEVA